MYKVKVTDPYNGTWEDDEVFDSESEAEEWGLQIIGNISLGAEILNMSNPGDNPLSDDDPDFEVIEV